MANVNAPRGFTPININWSRCHLYYKSAAVALGVGDPVIRATNSADPLGYSAVTRATTGSAVTGVVVGIMMDPTSNGNGNPRLTPYLASGDSGYVLVADDPEQEFLVQDNGGATGIAITAMGKHINSVTALNCDTTTGRSKYQIDTEAQSAANTWLLCRLDQKPDNVVGAYARWIVKASLHTESNASATNLTDI